ncbi:MAG: thiamine pyrophosphate-binding protein [Caldilineaceae bacterium]
MTVSRENSKLVYQGIKDAGIRFITALPETWLVYLLQMAEHDPEICLLEVAKEEEAIGIAAGAYFAGTPNLVLIQNHGFLGAMNGIVSLAMLYNIPLCMLVAHRGHMGEPYPWHTKGGMVTEAVLRGLGIPFDYARNSATIGRQIHEAHTLALSSLSPVALLLTRDLMEGDL